MTLGEFITWLGSSPQYIIGYFLLMPAMAALMWFIAKDQGHLSPWKYVYTTILYAVCIPGIASVAFNIYLFAFQRQDIYATNLFVQVLPILSMLVTIWLMKQNVDFKLLPGFDRLSQLITIIFCALLIMWLADKVRIYSFTYVPLWQILLILGGLILAIRYAWQKLV